LRQVSLPKTLYTPLFHTCHMPGPSDQRISPGPRPCFMIHNMIRFYGGELLAPRPTPKLEDHPLSEVRDCLFNIFAATVHTASRSSIRQLRTRHAVVTGTHLLCTVLLLLLSVVTYLLTPCSRVHLEKRTGFQLVKKFPAFYGNGRFITAFTSARHLSLS